MAWGLLILASCKYDSRNSLFSPLKLRDLLHLPLYIKRWNSFSCRSQIVSLLIPKHVRLVVFVFVFVFLLGMKCLRSERYEHCVIMKGGVATYLVGIHSGPVICASYCFCNGCPV